MDVFALRNQLIRDYATHIESFFTISNDHIRAHVDGELREGLLWPGPLLQLKPNFEPGSWIDDLVDDGKLHHRCRPIFRIRPTGEPDKPLSGANEDCEAACYNCLMSYYNQMDHVLLGRQLIRDMLLQLANGALKASSGPLERCEHLRTLKALCESNLGRDWLDFLETYNLRLPDAAQKLIEPCHTPADFVYTDHAVAIYIDGLGHDYPDIAGHNAEVAGCLESCGYTVIRFGYRKQHCPPVCAGHSYEFGRSEGSERRGHENIAGTDCRRIDCVQQ